MSDPFDYGYAVSHSEPGSDTISRLYIFSYMGYGYSYRLWHNH